jgi:hypothetical protein
MPIVALAFHEELAKERLERYFDSVRTSGGASGCVKCAKCGVSFAIILVNRADKDNAQYPEQLRALIEEDCISGLHRDEYVLSVGHVVEQ